MKRVILYIVLLTALISCDKDLDFEGFKSKPSLVVQGFFTSDSIVRIRITQTVDIMSNVEDGLIVSDASAEIIDASGNKYAMNYTSNGYYVSNLMPDSGKSIQIYIRKAGLKDLRAIDSLPKTKPVISIDTARGPLNRFEIALTLKDPVFERNYYILQVLEKSKHYIKRPKDPSIIDTVEAYFPVIFGSGNNIFVSDSYIQEWVYDFEMFDDGFLNGLNYKLNLTVDDLLLSDNLLKSKSESMIVLVKSISKSYYDYYLSVIRNSRNYGGPFSTNFNPTSNISGGFGIFCGYVHAADSIQF